MNILDEAKRIVDNDRQKEYGDSKSCFARIASFWATYLAVDIGEQDVANLMMLMKIARLQGTPGHRDSLIDVAGYAYCADKLSAPMPVLKTMDGKTPC